MPRLLALARTAHIGPTLAVTLVVALLAVSTGLETLPAVLVTGAVFAGQLTIGWGNDLVDLSRDRTVGRADKPLAAGALTVPEVARWLLAAAAACVVLSVLAGWRSGVVHLGLGVASGHAYNLWLKSTPWSWLPYAVAFGTLPAVVTLAGDSPRWPAAWLVVTAAGLGVGAHLLNALPDLSDDERTGVRGLPHRLGAGRSRRLATGLVTVASVAAVLGPAGPVSGAGLAALGAVGVLAVVALAGRGRTPFYAAIAIALVDVALLTAMS